MNRKTYIQKLNSDRTSEFFNKAQLVAKAEIANPYTELHPEAFSQYEEEMFEAIKEQDYARVAVLAAYLAQGR